MDTCLSFDFPWYNVYFIRIAMRARLLISTLIGLASGFLCWFLMIRFQQGAADFQWAIHLAHRVLARQNPYDTPLEQYPLTAGVFALPFLGFSAEAAAAVFYGLSSGLLAFGLTRHGYHRLLIFLAFPYWSGLLTVQWSAAVTASAFFPILLPFTSAKPQIGLPVFLTRLSRTGLAVTAAVVLATFAFMPNWPRLWLAQSGNYQHFIPLLIFPGPLLLLVLLRYRDRDGWLLLVGACMPQRWFYDPFFLWLIPKTRRQIVYTAGLSWVPGIWRWYHTPHSFMQVGRWTVLWLYLPMLVVLLLRKTGQEYPSEPAAPEQTDSGDRS